MTTSYYCAPENLQIKLRLAARALGNAGLVHAYGHCSVRLDPSHFLVCASEPLGSIKPGEDGTVVPVEGALPEGVLGEVRIHQQVYALRPAVNAICRIMPPNIMALSTQHLTPLCRHGLSAYFANDIPLWKDPSLLRSDPEARKLAQTMGERPAIVMRGNGAVIAGHSLEEAVTFSWFLEDTARVEMAVRQSGFDATAGLLSTAEVSSRQVTGGRVFERMWRYLTHGDPEQELLLDTAEDDIYSASTLFV